MSDLFDQVKSAPPPDNMPPSLQQINRASNSPLEVPALTPLTSPISINELANDLVTTSPKILPKQPIIRLKRLSLQENNDDNKSDKESVKSSFTKTKAQQKQFDDELPQSSGEKKKKNTILITSAEHKISHSLSGQIKKCCVFLKRLKEEEICIHTQLVKVGWNRSKIKSDLLKVSPKRTVYKKSNTSNNSFTQLTSSKKNKPIGSSTPIHFKILPPKLRKAGAIKKRIKTHPPIFNIPNHRCELPSDELIKEFGVRVFRSYVRVKNCKHPTALAFEACERVRKSRRPNLSVSFREAVEIIGHTGGEGPHCSVPTRLAKVENGEVVQFVGLDQSNYTKMWPVSASSETLLGSSKKHRKKRISSEKLSGPRRGSKSAKHSGENRTLPLSGMARLCINDDDITSANVGITEEEYIVPIDLSGCHGAGKIIKDDASSSHTPQQENENEKLKPSSSDMLKLLPPSIEPVEKKSCKSENSSTYPSSTENQNTKNENHSTNKTEESANVKCTSSIRQVLKQPTLGIIASSTKEHKDSKIQEILHIDTTKINDTVNITICSPIKEMSKLRCQSEESDVSFRSANEILLDDVNWNKLNSPPPTTLIRPKAHSSNINNINEDIVSNELTVVDKCVPSLDKRSFSSQEFKLPVHNSFTLSDETMSIKAAQLKDSEQFTTSATAENVNSDETIKPITIITTSPLPNLPPTDNLTESNTKQTIEDKIPVTKSSKPSSPIHEESNLNELHDTLNLQCDATENLSLELRREGNLVEDLMKVLDP